MNEHEAQRIAAAMHQLRPDWPLASVRTLITKRLAERDRRDVAVALAWVACESNSATPARVLEAGPWWRAAAVEDGGHSRRPPKRGEDCPHHPGQWADNCGGCEADRRGIGYEETTPATPPPPAWGAGDAKAGAAACRAAMRGDRP